MRAALDEMSDYVKVHWIEIVPERERTRERERERERERDKERDNREAGST